MSSLPDPALLARRDAEDGVEHVLVGAVLDCGGQILLLRRENSSGDGWELPCGPVRPGEGLLAALTRVVAEETGLPVGEVGRYLGEVEHTISGTRCRQHVWSITTDPSETAQPSRRHAYAWIIDGDQGVVSRETRALIRQYRHHDAQDGIDPWPLAELVLRTPRLELRPDDDAGLRELALLGAAGVHPAEEMPMGSPWTDAAPTPRARGTMQSSWRRRAAVGPESWGINWLIRYRDEVIGTQLLYADEFHTTREVGTGSWLGLAHQGRGLGTEARAAVLLFAFDHLDACQARTTSWADNRASQRINAKLGYQPDGSKRETRRGEPATVARYLLTRENFENYRPEWTIEVAGPTSCLPLLGADG